MSLLREEGVCVPLHLDGSTSTVDAAIDALGLPLVVKARRSSGGRGVVIARDDATAHRAAQTLSNEAAIFEEFIDGEQLGFCAVFRDGDVLQEAGIEHIRYDVDSVTPTDSVRTLDDEPLFALGRQVIAVVGGTGLVDLDILRDRTGRDFVVDVNLRAWGSLGALLNAGVDFTDGYLNVLGVLLEAPSTSRALSGVEISFSLFLRNDNSADPKLSTAAVWFVGASYRRIRDFGIRYWLSELLTHATDGIRYQLGKLLTMTAADFRERLAQKSTPGRP